MMKHLLISIDTEGDNLWKWRPGDRITTENAKFLPRFQELCESYGFIPTYLTNFEMAKDPFFADYFKMKLHSGKCEVGMHLHAWNCPPDYDLPVRTDVEPGAPFLIEYTDEIMEQKIVSMTKLLESVFDQKPIVHRAGRWATDDRYFRLLDKYGYKIDCSVTPGVNWSKAAGQTPGSKCNDYT
ncbi:MAG: deacetylase, partial [Clostridia bacterium]|nr:deacetylase [Clostridia bacterium]